ncbi:DUF6273 domain-containing protein [Lachnospiraceae bacterium 46-15]
MKEKPKNKSSKPKRLLSLLLTAALVLSPLPAVMPERNTEKAEAADVVLKNPRIVPDDSMEAGQKVTWDCVWFGSYPQAEVIPSGAEYTALDENLRRDGDVIVSDSIYAALQSASGWDANNDITLNGAKYRRMKQEDATYTGGGSGFYQWGGSTDYRYFKYEPIKWRVLHTDGNQALLQSDAALDDQKYHTVYEDVTWETSTVRSWLNGYGAGSNQQSVDYGGKNFIGSAFTASEQAAIVNSSLENADNLKYGTEGGNDTTDKIFLLSESDVWNTDKAESYGFTKDKYTADEARRRKSSTWAKAMGMWSVTSTDYAGNGWWWLRSPGFYSDRAMYVNDDGQVYYNGDSVIPISSGICPALNLNLSSPNLYTYAGTVCSDGTDAEVGGGTVPPGGETPEPGVPGGETPPSTPSENDGNVTEVDNSKIAIQVVDYGNPFSEIEGARVEIEGIGTAVTDQKGTVQIKNSLTLPSAMKRITVTKEGYRDYIFYTTVVHPEAVSLFETNKLLVLLKQKKAEDNRKPYVSTAVYYRCEHAQKCAGQYFEKSDIITFRVCGVWSGKEPGRYCIYQEGGKTFESRDGVFTLDIGKSFSGDGKIYAKLIAADGTESEPEWLYIRVPKAGNSFADKGEIPILNETSKSGVLRDVPFLHNDELSFDLGKIKTTFKRDGEKIRMMLGGEFGEKTIGDDEAWKSWKKFFESQPYDLSLSQWKNVLAPDNLETHWTSKLSVNAGAYGWLENDMAADSSTPMTGGIKIEGSGGVNFQQQYTVGPVPVYAEESFIHNLEFEGSVSYDVKEREFVGSKELKWTPTFTVGGGAGVLYVAKVGLEGEASMPVTIDFPMRLSKAELTGSLSLKADVLGFKYSKKITKDPDPPYIIFPFEDEKAKSIKARRERGSDNSEKRFENTMGAYDMDGYTLPVQILSESCWYGDKQEQVRKSRAAVSGMSEKLLQTGVSELTEPMLVQEGDTTLAAFLIEDSSRPTIHRTKLVYTVYDKETGTWSEPQAVAEDRTGDFYPHLTGKNGRIAVSWLNYDASVTNSSSMEEVFQSGEICTALWDADAGCFREASVVVSSSPSAAYSSARIVMDGDGNLTAAGLKNTAADIFGLTGDNILFMEGTCGNAAVHREFTLSQGLPVTYDVSETGGVVTAAVCVDTDRDLATLEDREIYLFTSNGNITRLTQNESYDSAPQYARYQGETALFWYTLEGYRILDASGKQNLVPAEKTGISENFTVVNGEGNQTALVWSSVDENQVYQLTASLYDEASGTWSSKVLLSDSGESIFRPNGYYNADGEMEVLYRKGSSIGAGKLYAMQLTPKPDVEIVDAYIKDGTEIPGENTTIYAVVRNLGTEKVTKCRVTADGQATDVRMDILPGESVLLEASYTVPETVSHREIVVQADVERDKDTTNNQFRLTAGYADVSAVVTEDVWENGKTVHVTAGNSEAVPTEAVLEIHKDTIDGELVSSAELGTLKQGDLVTVDFTYPKGKDGYETDANALYYVVTSSAPEKYESDNYDYTVFRVEESGSSGGDTPMPPKTETPSAGQDGTSKPPAPAPAEPSVKKGQTVKIGRLKYKVSKVRADGTGEATLTGTASKKDAKKLTSLKTGNTVKINKKNFKVTAIAKNAFKQCKKLKSIVIGKYVSFIGAKAFSGCKALKKITIKSAKLKKVGKNAFKGIYAKASVKAPKAKRKAYRKLLRAGGAGSKVRIK